MSRALRDIAWRRERLALLTSFERRGIAENRLWSSGPFIAAELLSGTAKFAVLTYLRRRFLGPGVSSMILISNIIGAIKKRSKA
jgi:hypothetical protein